MRPRAEPHTAPMSDRPATVIPFACPACGHTGRAASDLAGREVGCPACDGRVVIPPPHADPMDTLLPDPQADTHRVVQRTRQPAEQPPPAPPAAEPLPTRGGWKAVTPDLERKLSEWFWVAAVTLVGLVLLAAVVVRLMDQ